MFKSWQRIDKKHVLLIQVEPIYKVVSISNRLIYIYINSIIK
jgi:hypothetical protein